MVLHAELSSSAQIFRFAVLEIGPVHGLQELLLPEYPIVEIWIINVWIRSEIPSSLIIPYEITHYAYNVSYIK
jgi:hypothetical protein